MKRQSRHANLQLSEESLLGAGRVFKSRNRDVLSLSCPNTSRKVQMKKEGGGCACQHRQGSFSEPGGSWDFNMSVQMEPQPVNSCSCPEKTRTHWKRTLTVTHEDTNYASTCSHTTYIGRHIQICTLIIHALRELNFSLSVRLLHQVPAEDTDVTVWRKLYLMQQKISFDLLCLKRCSWLACYWFSSLCCIKWSYQCTKLGWII